MANKLEAYFYFYKTNDEGIDQRMWNAFIIKDYELKFHFFTGLAFSALSLSLPAWRGYNLGARVTISTIPFILSMYRGYRRGYDQVVYVGTAFMEHHLRRKLLLEYFRDHDDFLPDFKQRMIGHGAFDNWLKLYGLNTV